MEKYCMNRVLVAIAPRIVTLPHLASGRATVHLRKEIFSYEKVDHENVALHRWLCKRSEWGG